MADDPSTFNRRMKRVVDRFWTRAESREGSHIFDIYKKDEIEASVGQAALDPLSYKTTAMDETNAHREYVVKESVAQYKDYYESDAEEGSFFEYLDNLSNRDRIRFMESLVDGKWGSRSMVFSSRISFLGWLASWTKYLQ